MSPLDPHSAGGPDEAMGEAAARWVVRRDRTLSAQENAELAAWLAADPRHEQALRQATHSWEKFRELRLAVRRAPSPTRLVRERTTWVILGGLAAAAVFLLALRFERRPNGGPAAVAPTLAAVANSPGPVIRRLPDGSTARLNAGAELEVAFGPDQRRVRLVSGEALFEVSKDPARPFLVGAGSVTVRAVGTAFAVRFEPRSVDVLVTEGTVQVIQQPAREAERVHPAGPAYVGAGHRATVPSSPDSQAPVVVSAVSPAEIDRSLAWAKPMLDLNDVPLGELVALFSRRSGRKMEIADPALAATRIGGKFPTDDVDGFLRGLREIYDVRAEPTADGGLLLRKGP